MEVVKTEAEKLVKKLKEENPELEYEMKKKKGTQGGIGWWACGN